MLTTSTKSTALVSRSLGGVGVARSNSFSWLLCCLLSVQVLFAQTANAATADDWRSRSIYQIITDRFARTDGSTSSPCNTTAQLYCGGTFQGIINQLDYIHDMGFTANINETTEYGEAYHGFWTQDITTTNKNFGTPDDLKALSKAVHDRDMYLMIDVVINDVAYPGPGAKTDYSMFVPFNKKEYFHPFCYISDYGNNTNAQDCWLGDDIVALADLDTESDFVKNTWDTWVTEMVANYSLDGLRVDAAKHVDKPFWPSWQQAAGTFTIGEVFDASPSAACYWAVDALTTVLNYPSWYYITSILANSSNSMEPLGSQFAAVERECYDTTIMGTFSENHDVARFAWYSADLSQGKNALVYDFFTDGIPVVYYGAEQGFAGANDPQNRAALWLNPTGYDKTSTLYQYVKTLNTARSAVNNYMIATNYSNWSPYWAYKASIIYTKNDALVWRKGNVHSVVTALTNVGSEGADVGPYYVGDTGFSPSVLVIDVLSCQSQTAGIGGEINIKLTKGEPQVWIPGSLLVNTTLCPEPMKNVNKTHYASSYVSSAPSSFASSSTLLSSCILFISLIFLSSA
ncbi:Acid alpha-amylase protein [Rutstroemia sp. NJR-2017a BBW]|nr:Acid alpha-amylase protein [Rutstroemia sp. NJR-2017a BBW]